MSQKMLNIFTFNKDLMTMIEKIKKIFPEDKKIASSYILADNYINKLGIIKLPSSQYYAQVKKREKPFLNRDFDFFEKDSHKHTLADGYNIGRLYKDLTDQQIDELWTDLHNLYDLAKKIHG